MLLSPKFEVGSIVQWNDLIPKEWHFIYTSEPMKVEKIYYENGEGSDLAKLIASAPMYADWTGTYVPEENNGFDMKPGFVYELSCDGSKGDYYDPPISVYSWDKNKPTIMKMVHEMWLAEIKNDTTARESS